MGDKERNQVVGRRWDWLKMTPLWVENEDKGHAINRTK